MGLKSMEGGVWSLFFGFFDGGFFISDNEFFCCWILMVGFFVLMVSFFDSGFQTMGFDVRFLCLKSFYWG